MHLVPILVPKFANVTVHRSRCSHKKDMENSANLVKNTSFLPHFIHYGYREDKNLPSNSFCCCIHTTNLDIQKVLFYISVHVCIECIEKQEIRVTDILMIFYGYSVVGYTLLPMDKEENKPFTAP